MPLAFDGFITESQRLSLSSPNFYPSHWYKYNCVTNDSMVNLVLCSLGCHQADTAAAVVPDKIQQKCWLSKMANCGDQTSSYAMRNS